MRLRVRLTDKPHTFAVVVYFIGDTEPYMERDGAGYYTMWCVNGAPESALTLFAPILSEKVLSCG